MCLRSSWSRAAALRRSSGSTRSACGATATRRPTCCSSKRPTASSTAKASAGRKCWRSWRSSSLRVPRLCFTTSLSKASAASCRSAASRAKPRSSSSTRRWTTSTAPLETPHSHTAGARIDYAVAMRNANFWREKCVVVTGASSGIGRAFAIEVARSGGKLGLIARRTGELAAVASEIRAAGGKAEFRAADVAEAEPLTVAAHELESSLGPCDVALASAGIYRKTPGATLDADDVSAVVATNVLGVSNLFAAVLPSMLARKSGRLAAVASIAGLLGLPQGGAYSASKAAVITLLQSLRLDLAPQGIGVTVILPGYVDTPMITDRERRTLRGIVSAEDAARRIARAIERGRGEAAFPWGVWLEARLAGLLPPQLYQVVMGVQPPLEEAPPAGGEMGPTCALA